MSGMDEKLIDTKAQRLEEIIRGLGTVMIAYSGGVDSSLLAYYGRRVLGNDATVIIAVSESLAQDELQSAREQGKAFGWNVLEISTDEVGKPEYQRNDAMRCYFCKATLFEAMENLARQNQVSNLAYGANIDDLSDFRPGHRAAAEYRVLSPLQDAKLSKEEIRQLAKVAGLPSWDKPQAACLSSRFPTFVPITVSELSQVDKAESFLRLRGFRQVRVRHHDTVAHIEVEPGEVGALLADGDLYQSIVQEFKKLGYLEVTIDPQGYRQGSANIIDR
jgi:uncharacterized protein